MGCMRGELKVSSAFPLGGVLQPDPKFCIETIKASFTFFITGSQNA